MSEFEVLLGIDRAARDTGRRLTVRAFGRSTIEAAIAAESLADARLGDPLLYSHAIRVRPALAVTHTVPSAVMPRATPAAALAA